jgi:hypothetical protein
MAEKIKTPKKLIPKGGNDRVYTPDWLAEAIVNHFKPFGSCLEPCKGGGAFVRAMKKFGITDIDTMEIDEGDDFLNDILFRQYNWSISNWPWSKFRAFLKGNLRVADNIVTLTTVNHVISLKARLRDIKEAGYFVREILFMDTPKEFPQSGLALGAILLNKEAGDCKFSYLK